MKKNLSGALFFLCFFLAIPAFSQTKTWSVTGGLGQMWNTNANWSPTGVPGPGDDVIFDGTGNAPCSLNVTTAQVRSITFTSGYTARFSFQSNTLEIVGGSGTTSDFRSGGQIAFSPGPARLRFLPGAGNTTTLIPNPTSLPAIEKQGQGAVVLATAPLKGTGLTIQDGYFDFGDEGLIHEVESIMSMTGSNRTLDFGTSTVKIMMGNADFGALDNLIAGTGTLEFAAPNGFQNFYPKLGLTHPHIKNTGGDTLWLNGDLIANSFVQNAPAVIEFNGNDISTVGNFTLTGDATSVKSPIGGITLTVGGSLTVVGSTGSRVPISGVGTAWTLSVSGTTTLDFCEIRDCNSVGGPIAASHSGDVGGNAGVTFARVWDGGGGANNNWSYAQNWDEPEQIPSTANDSAVFNAISANNCILDAPRSIKSLRIIVPYTGTFDFALNQLTLTGTGYFNTGGAFINQGEINFSGSGSQEIIPSTSQNLGDIRMSGSGTLTFKTNGALAKRLFHPSNGTVHLGTEGLIHDFESINSISPGGGTLHFGNSTVKLRGVGLISDFTYENTLSFSGASMDVTVASSDHTLKPHPTQYLPDIKLSGAGTLRFLVNGLKTGAVTLENGMWDWGSGFTHSLASIAATGGQMDFNVSNVNVNSGDVGLGAASAVLTTGGALYFMGTGTQTLTPKTAVNHPNIFVSGGGTLVLSGNGLITNGLNITSGTLDLGDAGLIHTVASIGFSGGSLDFGTSTLKLTGISNQDFSSLSSVTSGTGGTLEFSAASSSVFFIPKSGVTFGDVKLSGAATLSIITNNLTAATLNIAAGNLSLSTGRTYTISSLASSGAGNLNLNNGASLTVSGDVDLSGFSTLSAASGSMLTLAGGGSQILKPGSGSMNPAIVLSGSGSYTVTTNSLVSDSITVNAGTWNWGSGLTHTIGRIECTGGSMDFGSSTVQLTLAGVTSDFSGLSGFTSGTGALQFTNASGTHTLVPEPGASFPVMTLSGAGGVTLAGALSVADLTLTGSGSFNCGAGYTHSLVSLTCNSGSNLDFNTSTVKITTGNADLSGASSINFSTGAALEFSASAAQTFTPKSSTTLPPVTHTGTGTVTVASYGLTTGSLTQSTGGWHWGSGSLLHPVGTLTLTSGTMDFGNGQLRLTGGGTQNFSGATSITAGTGTLELNSGSVTFASHATSTLPPLTVNVSGTVTFSANGLKTGQFTLSSGAVAWGTSLSHSMTGLSASAGSMDFGSSTVKVTSGNVDLSSLSSITPGTGTLEFGQGSAITFTPLYNNTQPNLSLTGSGNVTISPTAGPVNSGNVSVTAGGLLFTGGFTYNVGSLTVNGGSVTLNTATVDATGDADLSGASTVSAASGTLRFSASSGTQTFSPKSGASFGNVTIAGGSGSVLLAGTGFSTSALTITSGTLDLSDVGLTHSTGTFSAAGGNLDFGNSRLQISSGNVDFSSLVSLTAPGGSNLDFIHASGSFSITPKSGTQHPNLTFTLGSSATGYFAGNVQAGTLTVNSGYCAGGSSLSHNVAMISTTGGTLELGNSTTIQVNSSTADLSGLSTLVLNGTLAFAGGSAQTLIPKAGQPLYNLVKNGSGTLTVSTNNLKVYNLTLNAGTLSLGSQGAIDTILAATFNGGTLDFGNSTYSTSGSLDFSALSGITPGTGNIYLTSTGSAQTLTPKASAVHPAIWKTGAATFTLSTSALQTNGYTQTAGQLNLGGVDLSVANGGDFTITNGSTGSLTGVDSRTITVSGNFMLAGTVNTINPSASSGWTLNVAGTLEAVNVYLSNCTASGSQGLAMGSTNAGNNVNWLFVANWDGGGTDNNWSTVANWAGDVVPGANDSIVFTAASVKKCSLDAAVTVKNLKITGAYTGTFDLAHDLTVTGDADFSGVTSFGSAAGTLLFTGTTQNWTPPTSATSFGNVSLPGYTAVTVLNSPIHATGLTLTNGELHLGNVGTHTVSSVVASGGSLYFDAATLQISGSPVNLSLLSYLDKGTGTLAFTGTGTQVFSPKSGVDHPAITHTGSGTLQLSGSSLTAQAFSQSGGTFDFNGQNLTVTPGNLTVTNGTGSSFANLGGRTLIVTGNASFTGTYGNFLNLNPSTAWTLSLGGSLSATSVNLARCDASGGTRGFAIGASDGGNNLNWRFIARWDGGGNDNLWSTAANWVGDIGPGSSDSVLFDQATASSCGLDVDRSVDHLVLTSAYTGTFDFLTHRLTVQGNADFSSGGNITSGGTGSLEFSGTGAHQFTPKAGQQFPNLLMNGSGAVTTSSPAVTAYSLTLNSGTWNLGNSGAIHAVGTLTATGGTLNFGNSTVRVTSGNVNLSGLSTLTAGTGALEFAATGGTQAFTPHASQTHPNLLKSGAGTVNLINSFYGMSFTEDAGLWNWGSPSGGGIVLTSLTVNGGSMDFGSADVQVSGGADFTGINTLTQGTGILTLNAATGSQSLRPPSGKPLPALVKNNNGTLVFSSVGMATQSLTVSGGTVDFGGFAHDISNLSGAGGTLNFGTATVRVSGAADFSGLSGILTSGGTVDFNAASGTQNLNSHATLALPALLHSAAGTLRLNANHLITRRFIQTAGVLDFNAFNLTTTQSGAFSVTNGGSGTFVNLGGKTLTVAGALTLSGQSSNLLNLDPGTGWSLTVSGASQVDHVQVKNSDASAGNLVRATQSQNDGNNQNWLFGTAPLNVSGFTATAIDTVSIRLDWTVADTTVDSIYVQVDTGSYQSVNSQTSVRKTWYPATDTGATVAGLHNGILYFVSAHTKSEDFFNANADSAQDTAQTPAMSPFPPLITTAADTDAVEDSLYTLDINATDANGDSVWFTLDYGPTGLGLNGASGLVSWTPGNANVGDTFVSVIAHDGILADTLSYQLTVANRNDAPILGSLRDTSVAEDAPFQLSLSANDVDLNQTLVFTLDSGPTGLALTPSLPPILTWRPANGNVGAHAVALSVSDGVATVRDTFIITVVNANDPPAFASSLDTLKDSVGVRAAVWSASFTAQDPDSGDALIFSLSAQGFPVTLDPTAGNLSYTPALKDTGKHAFQLSVTDGAGARDSLIYILNVLNGNGTPVFASFPDTLATEDILYSETPPATDPDLDSIVYKFLTAPAGLILDSLRGTLTWTPRNADIGRHAVSLRASDAWGGADTLAFVLTVQGTNDVPVILTALSADTALEDALYLLQIQVQDVDGDAVTITPLLAPTGFTADSMGRVTWHPGNSDVGVYDIELEAGDKKGGLDTIKYKLYVRNVNDAPDVLVESITLNYGAVKLEYKVQDEDRKNKSDAKLKWDAGVYKFGVGAAPKETLFVQSGEATAAETLLTREFYPLYDGSYRLFVRASDSVSSTLIDTPFTVGTGGQSLTGHAIEPSGWRMISLPLRATLTADELSDAAFRVFRYDPVAANYVGLADETVSPSFSPGVGYWVLTDSARTLSVPESLKVTSADTVHLPVRPGWNMIASPYPYAVQSALSAGSTLYSWADTGYQATDIMDPWKSYFYFSEDSAGLMLDGRPYNPGAAKLAARALAKPLFINRNEWMVRVSARGSWSRDAFNYLGVGPDARGFVKPPESPLGGVSLHFESPSRNPLPLIRELRPAGQGTYEWTVAINPGADKGNISLGFDGLEALPHPWAVFLGERDHYVSLREKPEILVEISESRYYTLVVTDDPDFLKKNVREFSILPNHPNPFNPSTRIAFAIPRQFDRQGRPLAAGLSVSLKIYDGRGRLVRTLMEGPQATGRRYSVEWDGKSAGGKPAASGIYFYRLNAGGKFLKTRKMILAK